jgi:predicted ArsR family transcriptional regulator
MATKISTQQVLAALTTDAKTVKVLAAELGVTGATVKKHVLALLATGSVTKRGTQKASSPTGRGRPADLFFATGVAFMPPPVAATTVNVTDVQA